MVPNEMVIPQQRIFSKSASMSKHDIYISGVITGPENYREEMELIRNMGPDDVTYMHYNSGGGDASTATQFMHCMKETQGTVYSVAEGTCASAATLMFLSGHGFDVADHTEFMCHQYSGMRGGKGSDLWQQAKFDKEWSDRLMKDVYRDFMTDEEITTLIDGGDFWFHGEEVIERCQRMVDLREGRAKGEEESEKAEGEAKEERKSNDVTVGDLTLTLREGEVVLVDTKEGQILGTYWPASDTLQVDLLEGEVERDAYDHIIALLRLPYRASVQDKTLKTRVEKVIRESGILELENE